MQRERCLCGSGNGVSVSGKTLTEEGGVRWVSVAGHVTGQGRVPTVARVGGSVVCGWEAWSEANFSLRNPSRFTRHGVRRAALTNSRRRSPWRGPDGREVAEPPTAVAWLWEGRGGAVRRTQCDKRRDHAAGTLVLVRAATRHTEKGGDGCKGRACCVCGHETTGQGYGGCRRRRSREEEGRLQ